MADHEQKSISVDEIWFKNQRALRTLFTTVITILPLIPQVIQIVQGQWDAAWLNAVAVQAVAINTALTRIIAIPQVNEWLTAVGLGSVPKKAAERQAEAERVGASSPEQITDGSDQVAGTDTK